MRKLFAVALLGLAACSSSHGTAAPVAPPTNVATTTTEPNHGCATEAATFITAREAYRASNNGRDPAGGDGLAIARALAQNSGGGPFLQSANFTYYDPSPTPAPKRWTWNVAARNTVQGTACV